MSFTEYKNVEKEILETRQTPALGWRDMPGKQVTTQLRGGDEQEVLLIPILREKLKSLNPDLFTDDARAT